MDRTCAVSTWLGKGASGQAKMTFVYSRVDYKNQPCLVTIDNMVYDCTGFKEHHPGGDEIMMKYHNKDATEVFHAFHGEAGFEKLKNMSSRATPVENPKPAEPHIIAFRKLRQKLIDEGWFNSNPLWQTYKSTETIGLCMPFDLLSIS
jgi:hypothetical protein